MKLQIPIIKTRNRPTSPPPSLELGDWCFSGCWSLVLGCFDLTCRPQLAFLLLIAGSFPCPAADPNRVLDAWFVTQASVHSWSADLIQTRTLKTLTQPLAVKGHIDFAAPSDFRWALGQPARTLAVRHDDEMYVVYPLLKRAERYSLGASTPKQLRDTMSLLQAGFPHDREEFNTQFQILSLIQTNGNWLFALQPKSPFARQMMPELRLGLATNDYSLASTELVFVDGSTMRSDFTNAVVNPVLDTNLFLWTPPADYQVTNPLAP